MRLKSIQFSWLILFSIITIISLAYADLDQKASQQSFWIVDTDGNPIENARISYGFLRPAFDGSSSRRGETRSETTGLAIVPYDELGVGLHISHHDFYQKSLTIISPELANKMQGLNPTVPFISFWEENIILSRKLPKVPMYVSARPSSKRLEEPPEMVEFGYEFLTYVESKKVNPKMSVPLLCDIVFELKRTGTRQEAARGLQKVGLHTYQVRVYGRNGWRIQPTAVSVESAMRVHEAPDDGYVEEVVYQSLAEVPRLIYVRKGGEFDERYGVVNNVRLDEFPAKENEKPFLEISAYYKIQSEYTGNRSLDPDPKKEKLPPQYRGDSN